MSKLVIEIKKTYEDVPVNKYLRDKGVAVYILRSSYG